MRMTGDSVKLRHVKSEGDWRELTDSPCSQENEVLVAERVSFSGLLADELCPESEEDELLVSQDSGRCVITGSNPRSVLFSVYELLRRLGARWVAPGHLGEVLPASYCKGLFETRINEKASYSHRGVCIEGAPSIKHALGMVDWMAKHKMNSFFLQFKTSLYFWRNYYNRDYNPDYGEEESVDEEVSLRLDGEVIDALKLRGMDLHRVGHGWTAECLGYKGLGWYETEDQPDQETRSLLALVNGERGFFGNVPINTELCYSNPRAFQMITDEIVEYAKEHPEVSYLHFWLSDTTNNFCECESCRKTTPSDWYARLINEVAKKLNSAGLETRVVFLCYTNTLSPPKKETLEDPGDRLVYMFAPISRCYMHAISDESCSGSGNDGGWSLNEVKTPRTNSEFVGIRKNWLDSFDGDSFIFDYYMWKPYLRRMDPIGFASIIKEDIERYGDLHLNGLISCQALRSFYPTGLLMSVMADTLWNRDLDLPELVDDHLRSCFGDNANEIKKYLSDINELLTPKTGQHHGLDESSSQDDLKSMIEISHDFSRFLEDMEGGNEREKRFLDLLGHYSTLTSLKYRYLLAKSRGEKEKSLDLMEELKEFLRSTERLTHRYLDTWLMLRSLPN